MDRWTLQARSQEVESIDIWIDKRDELMERYEQIRIRM